MSPRSLLFTPLLALGVVVGCYTGSSVDTNRAPTLVVGNDPTDPADDGSSGGTSGSSGGTRGAAATPQGLPCDVTELLKRACNDCHGARLAGGAPNRLMTFEDLSARSKSDPSMTVAQYSLVRMKSSSRPMPPAGRLPSAEISIFEKWVTAGIPRGTCGVLDGGSSSGGNNNQHDAGEDAGEPPPPPPPQSVCTSNNTQPGFGKTMKPGHACIACHSREEGPAFEIAGTVYPTLHEPNDCRGSTGVIVEILDATGVTHQLPVSAAGNFFMFESFPRPYRARVIRGNDVRNMESLQTDGDCNGCHTEFGNGAPGRIMAP